MGIAATRLTMALLAATLAAPVLAGPPPGVASPWNGPWGAGYMAKEPFVPWESPYYSAGYGFHYPSVYYGLESGMPLVPGQGAVGPGMQFLPGGGYILTPGAAPSEGGFGSGRGY
jgi:hypothetical protein